MTVLSPPRVEPVWAAEGWEVLTMSTPGGYVGTRLQDGGFTLVLGDQADDGGGAGTTSAELGRGGSAWVECRSAPPVHWLGAHGHRLAPEVPSQREELRLSPGDLLVLCSADVLEHLDHGLAHLAALTDGLGDPGVRARALAADLASASPAGAAAVAVWSPAVIGSDPTTGTPGPSTGTSTGTSSGTSSGTSTDPEEVRP